MLLDEKVFPSEQVLAARRRGSTFRTYVGAAEFLLRDCGTSMMNVDGMAYVMQYRPETDTYVVVLGNRKYTIASSFDRVVFSVREEEYELPKRKQQVLLLC